MTVGAQPLNTQGTPIVDGQGVPNPMFGRWLDYVKRVIADPSSIFVSSIVLIQVAAPSNANAATAGVAIGQLYTGTADPHVVYIRTV